MKIEYDFFDKIIYRTPINTIDSFFKIPNQKSDISLFVKRLFEDKSFRESIYLASPAFHNEWKKSYVINLNSDKKEKIEYNIIKYYIRTIFNCTPFGLFSSYALLSDKKNNNNLIKKSFIDFSFINKLYLELINTPTFQNKLTYSLNNSLYEIGNYFRYMEYIPENDIYQLTSIKRNSVLDFLSKDFTAKSVNQICLDIISRFDGITYDQTFEFIHSLIKEQFLLVDMRPYINNKDLVNQLTDYSGYIPELNEILKNKNLIKKEIDQYVNSNEIEKWNNLFKEEKITDSIINVNLKKESNIISSTILENDEYKIIKTIDFLNCIQKDKHHIYFQSNNNIKNFVESFIERYENRVLPLMEVLDTDAGIGYNNTSSFKQKDIIEDLFLDPIVKDRNHLYDDEIDNYWIRKICDSLISKEQVVNVSLKEVIDFKKRDFRISGTSTFVYSKINNKLLFIDGGGTSAQHYIGRFTTQDSEMLEFSSEVIDFENKYYKDRIIAEIIHIPSIPSGNLLSRNCRRNYEIPIYSKHSPEAIPIYLNDILICVRNNEIILKSKKYKKEIIPFLSSAQNFHSLSSPVYNFLCDLQAVQRENFIYFKLNKIILDSFPYIPRIELDNEIILKPGTWSFNRSNIESINSKTIKELRDKYHIPRYIDLIERTDLKITIDLENEYLLQIMQKSLDKYNYLLFTENLYLNSKSPAINEKLAHEFIISLKSKEVVFPTNVSNINLAVTKRSYIPADDWLYFKIYTNYNNVNDILLILGKLNKTLKKEQLIDSWFFIKYNDPDFHLRLRYHLVDNSHSGVIIETVNSRLKKHIKNKEIWKVELATYERELERYYDKNIVFLEKIFYCDSDFVINILKKLNNIDFDKIWMLAIFSINDLLDIFCYNTEQKSTFCENQFNAYGHELGYNKITKKQIDKLYRENSKLEELTEFYPFLEDLYRKRKRFIQFYIDIFFEKLNSIEKRDLLKSLIHMHLNRLLEVKPRLNEFIIYGFLTKYYKEKKWKEKKSNKNEDKIST